MTYQYGRCFFCGHAEGLGHQEACPVGLPSKHHFKKLWWEAFLFGWVGRPRFAPTPDPRETAVLDLGWVQGANYEC